MNLGEELVASYLEHVKGCEFIQQNLYTEAVQGEIDVVGIDLENRRVYFCEVAIHLQTGLQYTKDGRPNNVAKLTDKFRRNIQYANDFFKGYGHVFMLWTPIVKYGQDGAAHDQSQDIAQICSTILGELGVTIEVIANQAFLDALEAMREIARSETKDVKSPILRLYQIEEYTKKHVDKLAKRGIV